MDGCNQHVPAEVSLVQSIIGSKVARGLDMCSLDATRTSNGMRRCVLRISFFVHRKSGNSAIGWLAGCVMSGVRGCARHAYMDIHIHAHVGYIRTMSLPM